MTKKKQKVKLYNLNSNSLLIPKTTINVLFVRIVNLIIFAIVLID